MIEKCIKLLLIFLLIFGTLGIAGAKTSQNIWINVSVSAGVHNVTRDIWFNTISEAVATASNNNLIEVYPGTYNEAVAITNFTNLIIRAWAWTNSRDNTNTIVQPVGGYPFSLDNCKGIQIYGFTIIGGDTGVMIGQNIASISNIIKNNIICSNWDAGVDIFFLSLGGDTIMSNRIFRQQGFGARNAISVGADNNFIIDNELFGNNEMGGHSGIYLGGSYNYISGNIIYSNNYNIYMMGAHANIITNNIIRYSTNNSGIYLTDSATNIIIDNDICRNMTYGIEIGGMFGGNIHYNRIINNNISTNRLSGIYVSEGSNIIINDNTIAYNQANGLFLTNAGYCGITNNDIFNNSLSGIHLWDGGQNSLAYNNVETNQLIDIWVQNASLNSFIDHNEIYNNIRYGVYIENSTFAFIETNNIYNNSTNNIRLFQSDNVRIVNNEVYDSLKTGIYVANCISNAIVSNIVHHNGSAGNFEDGIWLYHVKDALVKGNTVYSNKYTGIRIQQTTNIIITGNEVLNQTNNLNNAYSILFEIGANVEIRSNRIHDNTKGLRLDQVAGSMVWRNLIANNIGTGINLEACIVSGLVNNTIFGNQDGIYLETVGANIEIFNNIVLSNTGYGMTNDAGAGAYRENFNDVYGNGTDYGGIIAGTDSISADPLIETVSSFTITSAVSPAVDTGTNVWGPGFDGIGWDMGWKESVFTQITATNVHVVYQGEWFDTITEALAVATNNDLIEVYSYVIYYESVNIANFTNLTISAWDWTNSQDNTSTIIDAAGLNNAFFISNSQSVILQGFTISNANQDGLLVKNSASLDIRNNRLMDHNMGVWQTDANNNTYLSNEIFKNMQYGMFFDGSSYSNTISYCSIYSQNTESGIWLNGENVDGNVIEYCDIYGNAVKGIYVLDGDDNRIENNVGIMNNAEEGIFLAGSAVNTIIAGNDIYNNTLDGINSASEGVDYTVISNNNIYDNKANGIYLELCDSSRIIENWINNNTTDGIQIIDDTATFSNEISYNEIYNNIVGIRDTGTDTKTRARANTVTRFKTKTKTNDYTKDKRRKIN